LEKNFEITVKGDGKEVCSMKGDIMLVAIANSETGEVQAMTGGEPGRMAILNMALTKAVEERCLCQQPKMVPVQLCN